MTWAANAWKWPPLGRAAGGHGPGRASLPPAAFASLLPVGSWRVMMMVVVMMMLTVMMVTLLYRPVMQPGTARGGRRRRGRRGRGEKDATTSFAIQRFCVGFQAGAVVAVLGWESGWAVGVLQHPAGAQRRTEAGAAGREASDGSAVGGRGRDVAVLIFSQHGGVRAVHQPWAGRVPCEEVNVNPLILADRTVLYFKKNVLAFVPEVGVRGGLPLLCPVVSRLDTGLGVFRYEINTHHLNYFQNYARNNLHIIDFHKSVYQSFGAVR